MYKRMMKVSDIYSLLDSALGTRILKGFLCHCNGIS